MMNSNVPMMTSQEILNVLALSKNATAIYTTNDIVIQSANDAMITLWGKDRSIVGFPLAEAVPELKGQPFIDLLKEVWRSGITHTDRDTPAELFVNGVLETFYFDFEYRAIPDENGNTYCILHTAVEVTDRMAAWKMVEDKGIKEQSLNEALMAMNEEYQAQNEELSALNEEYQATNEELNESQQSIEMVNASLKASESRFRHLIQKAPTGIAILKGKALIFEMVNDRLLNKLERGPDIIGKPFGEALNETRYKPYLALLQKVYATGKSEQGNGVKMTKRAGDDSPDRFLNYVYEPIKNATGAVTSIMIVATEVTELVQARVDIQRATEKLSMALEAAKLGSWHIDPQSRSLQYNPALATIFGYDGVEEMTYDQVLAQVTEEHREHISAEIEKAIRDNGDYDITYSQRRFDDGNIVWLRSIGKIISDPTGAHRIFSGVVMDVTEQKNDEERKNDFIGMVSHELKTPLTSLGAYIQLLERKARSNADEFSTGALEKANRQIKKMTAMINGFLNLSRLESGKIQLVKAPFELNELITEVIHENQIIASDYTILFDTTQPVVVFADREKIGNVLTNLLSNAIKYAPATENIEVWCAVKQAEVRVLVKDRGIGIPEEHLPQLFDRYFRVEDNQPNGITGFGIGLYLSAEIVKRHGGDIWAESNPGEGSVFGFSLPLE